MLGDEYNDRSQKRRLYSDDSLYESDDDIVYLEDTESHKLIPISTNYTNGNGFINTSSTSSQHYHRNTANNVSDPETDTSPDHHGYHDSVGYLSRRTSKRYGPWAFVTAFILFVLLMLYIPLSTNFTVPTRIVPIPGWEQNTTRDTTLYVLPNVNTTIIDPVHICANNTFLLVVVCSSSVNFEVRQSIRETWANLTEFNYPFFAKVHAKFKGQYLDINYRDWKKYASLRPDDKSLDNIELTNSNNDNGENIGDNINDSSRYNIATKVVFLVGQSPSNETQMRISAESELYGDLIQESFLDSYNNLTLKSIMMLKWVNGNCCDKVKFLMKCDDDTFVNIPNLLHVLLGGTVPVYNATVQEYDQGTIKVVSARNRLNQYRNLLMGSRFCHSVPISDIGSKWYSPQYMYTGNIYPNYLSGTGYVMSMDVVSRLYNVSLTTPLFHLEDVYLTGICAENAKIKPKNHQLFSYTSVQNPCEYKGMITKHKLSAMAMRRAYTVVTNTSHVCPKPDKLYRLPKVKTRVRNCN